MAIPTPLMVEVDELEKIHGDIAAKRSERAHAPKQDESRTGGAKQSDIPTVRRAKFVRPESPPAEKLETIATRPLETPVRAFETAGAPASAGRRGFSVAVLGAVVLLAIGGFAAWRTRAERPSASNDARPTPTTPATTSAAAPPQSVSAPTREPSAPVSVVSSTAPPPKTAVSTPSISATSSGTTAAGKAAVTFLGEPGTKVSIDGSSRGPCPVRVMLSEGPHEIRFTFEPTGESRGERLTVKSGDHVTVRAEFTGATPTVKIQR